MHVAAVDVSDETQLRAFLDRYTAEAWPPIRGVIHAAGSLDNHLAGSWSRAAFDAVVGPKLRGAQLLDRLLPDLDLFVLFSSMGGISGAARTWPTMRQPMLGLDALPMIGGREDCRP